MLSEDVDELLERSALVEIPADVKARMQGRLAEFRTRVEQRKRSRLRSVVDSIFAMPVFRVAAASAVVLAALAVVMILVPGGSKKGHVYAAAAAQLRAAQSLQYTFVIAPFTQVDFSFAAPAYRRVNCSWGIEVRSDGTGRELVLMHGTRSYVMEEGKKVDDISNSTDLVEQFRSLPATADETLGEQWVGGKRLVGYRVHHAPNGSAASGAKTLDLWVDQGTSNPDHVDITVQEPDKPVYQMHVKNIRVDAGVDRAVFDMSPPEGYSQVRATSGQQPGQGQESMPVEMQPEIKLADALTAVVVPMKGSFGRTKAAVLAVETQLKKIGVTPTGPAFGRFGSEQQWDAGYPVRDGTRVGAPFETVELPAATMASVVVKGAWGENSGGRWSSLLKWVVEHGYVPDGPPMEIWLGNDDQLRSQSTEMRIAVKKAG